MLTWQVAGHGPLRGYDERLGRAIAASGIPSSAAELLADLGNLVVALPVLLVVMAWAGWHGWREWQGAVASVRWWLPPVAAGLALAAVPALVVPLKLWLARPGPPQMAGGVHDGFYPSGHAATASVAYGVAVLLLARTLGSASAVGVGAASAVVVLLEVGVGVGLVRRGYHWPLDVLGSWCLAGVLLAAWCAVCDRWCSRAR